MLEYVFELGPIEHNIAKQAARAGQPLPARIANAPTLQIGLQLFLQAFFDLDSERSHVMGFCPIPRSKIRDYAREYELDEEQTEDMLYLIRYMDNEHRKRIEKKTEGGS